MKRLGRDAKMVIAIVALVIFAGYYFLVRPQAADVAQARLDRAGVEQSLADLQVLLQGAASDGPASSDADVAALAAAIPPDDELADLLRQLDATAVATGMVHSSISPSPVAPNPLGPGGSIQIAITATGTHDAARAYLAQLMGMPRLVLIEQVGLHVQPGGVEAQLQLAVRVFTAATPSVPL